MTHFPRGKRINIFEKLNFLWFSFWMSIWFTELLILNPVYFNGIPSHWIEHKVSGKTNVHDSAGLLKMFSGSQVAFCRCFHGPTKFHSVKECSIKMDPRLITKLKDWDGEKRKELCRKCGHIGHEVRGDLIAFVGKHRFKKVTNISKRLLYSEQPAKLILNSWDRKTVLCFS